MSHKQNDIYYESVYEDAIETLQDIKEMLEQTHVDWEVLSKCLVKIDRVLQRTKEI